MSLQVPPLFPRDKTKPLISILIPTRGRSVPLRQAVDSCYSLAKRKDWLEFIFKVDDDDTESLSTCEWFKGLGLNCQILTGPRRNGYFDMHHWVNSMAKASKG